MSHMVTMTESQHRTKHRLQFSEYTLQAEYVTRVRIPSKQVIVCNPEWNANDPDTFERGIMISHASTGKMLASFNNYFGGTNAPYVFKNDSSDVVTVVVSGWHKDGPPDEEAPWYESPSLILANAPEMRIGFADNGSLLGNTNPVYFTNSVLRIQFA